MRLSAKLSARLRLGFAGLLLLFVIADSGRLGAQQTTSGPWQIQSSNTTAGLRGIHAVNDEVAWASGTDGTVLRTTDGGQHWQRCATPPNAATLDFRGVWAWDVNTAMVMSSGPGALSRVYKTTDGCARWKLLFTDPDNEGFWDAIAFSDTNNGFLLGDPVKGRFTLFLTLNGGKSWSRVNAKSLSTGGRSLGVFAASNSAMILRDTHSLIFGTSGPGGPWLYTSELNCTMLMSTQECLRGLQFERRRLPMVGDSSTSGIFALAQSGANLVAVGGDYTKPNNTHGSAAAVTAWNGLPPVWIPATLAPHGYRSTVAWDQTDDAWITAGPNGSDVSYDGKTWQPLDDGNWNAIGLPWIVGPNGRIARLSPDRLPGH